MAASVASNRHRTRAHDKKTRHSTVPAAVDKQLDLDLVLHILSFLPSNHKAAVAKLVCKETYSAFKQHKSIDIATCDDLPAACVLELLQELQSQNKTQQQQQLVATAARQGNLPRVQLMREHGCEWGVSASAAAAEAGHLHVLRWLRAQDPPCPVTDEVCEAAAGGGHLTVLHWLHQRCPRGVQRSASGAAAAAARHGHLDILQWLKAQTRSCNWNKQVCEAAAEGGHLGVLQWLRAQDPPCEWDEYVCSAAARHGNLELLQWARAQEPPCLGTLQHVVQQHMAAILRCCNG